MLTQRSNQTALVCDLNALNAAQREQHQLVLKKLHESVQEIKELQNGLAFRHTAEISMIQSIAEFIALERL